MQYKEVIQSNGKIYVFESDPYEPKERFIKRVWFIIDQLNKDSTKPLDLIILESRKWINELVLDAKY